jgi:hypothetical protein
MMRGLGRKLLLLDVFSDWSSRSGTAIESNVMIVRRMKTYTGETGYVYQYYFVGKRPALKSGSEPAAIEYVFDVTADRKTTFAVSVFLREEALTSWTSAHGRGLTEAEQYAAAKMRLFRGFDEIADLPHHGRSLVIDSRNVEALLAPLGVD